jgi:hypothetical protein
MDPVPGLQAAGNTMQAELFKRPHELQQKPDDSKHKETLQKKAQMKRL